MWSVLGDGVGVYLGDCLDGMRMLPDNSVDAIVCDLPYGTTNCAWDTVLPFEALWEAYRRVLKAEGVVVLFGSQPFTSDLVNSNRKWFKYSLVWDKNKCGSPGLAKIRPMKVHEDILVFAPGNSTYNPQMEVGKAYSRKAPAHIRCNNHGYGFKNTEGINNEGTRYPKSILSISRDFSAQQQVHPTQKPVPLMDWLVKTYSNEGDVVLDNCQGSGSTGVACVRLGRKYLGMEMNQPYHKIAVERVTNALQEKNK